jgi:hypothetical protein
MSIETEREEWKKRIRDEQAIRQTIFERDIRYLRDMQKRIGQIDAAMEQTSFDDPVDESMFYLHWRRSIQDTNTTLAGNRISLEKELERLEKVAEALPYGKSA